jgi:hypothetical protein
MYVCVSVCVCVCVCVIYIYIYRSPKTLLMRWADRLLVIVVKNSSSRTATTMLTSIK